ncbi:MAG: sulfatase-like hydrolase/transferase [Cyclobacteriaceae bacterium]|nr:sulfatase-like hydrolase/transferase [Cyclobacteriaceae bacterium]
MTLLNGFATIRLSTNIFMVLIQRLLIIMVMMSLTRVFFYLYNIAYFPEVTLPSLIRLLWGGLRFDLTAVLYVNLPVILLMVLPLNIRFKPAYQRFTEVVFYVLNSFMLGANLADTVYYRFTLRRTTADVFRQFENETNLTQLFIRFMADYWYAVLVWVTLIALMVWWNRRYRIEGPQMQNRFLYYTLGVLSLPLIGYLFIGGVRGGFRHSTRPITISNAAAYVQQAAEVNVVLNTPFAVLRTIGKTKIARVNFYDEEELERIYSPVHHPPDTLTFRKYNVVIIILESFSREFIGALNKDKPGYSGFTPFLDSLIAHSLTFRYSLANGRKSIDALPSVLAGIPSMEVPYVLTPFSNNRIRALGTLLSERGYHTSFFHGAPNGSMGFDAFANMAGIKNYFGMTEYGNDKDFDGMWGIWDHKFLDFYAEKLGTFPQPFLSVFFSVSSHHPFIIPSEFEGRFKGGEQPILKCIEYTDYALRQFFYRIRRQPWFKETLFVITADHCSSNILFPESRTAWGAVSVPVIFYRPDNSLAGMRNEIAQQTDIMPSVLGYLGYNQPYLAFGRNVFSATATPFSFSYRDGYNYFEGEWLLHFDGRATGALYHFASDRMLNNDVKDEQFDRTRQMEAKIKAIIQQYNNRLLDNRLTPPM